MLESSDNRTVLRPRGENKRISVNDDVKYSVMESRNTTFRRKIKISITVW